MWDLAVYLYVRTYFQSKWLRGCDQPAVTPAHLRCIAPRCTLHCTLHAARCCGSRRLATDGKTGPGQRSGRGWNVHLFDKRRRRARAAFFFRRRVFVLLWPPSPNTIVVQSIRQSHSKMTSTHLSRSVRTQGRYRRAASRRPQSCISHGWIHGWQPPGPDRQKNMHVHTYHRHHHHHLSFPTLSSPLHSSAFPQLCPAAPVQKEPPLAALVSLVHTPPPPPSVLFPPSAHFVTSRPSPSIASHRHLHPVCLPVCLSPLIAAVATHLHQRATSLTSARDQPWYPPIRHPSTRPHESVSHTTPLSIFRPCTPCPPWSPVVRFALDPWGSLQPWLPY